MLSNSLDVSVHLLIVLLLASESLCQANDTQQVGSSSAAELTPESPAKNSVTQNSVVLLLDEISQLKLELVPDSAQQSVRKSAPLATASTVAPLLPLKKQIRERELAAGEQPTPQQETVCACTSISSSPPPLLASSGSTATTTKPTTQPTTPTPASEKTICDKSLAVGTLGYRLLCRHDARLDSGPIAEPGGAADGQKLLGWDQDMAALDVCELVRLKSLLARLIRSGNFRSLSAGSSTDEIYANLMM